MKRWLITATVLVCIGLLVFVAAMCVLDWDFTKLSTREFQTNTYDIDRTFDDISINADTADIVFAFSDDGKCKVVCFEEENINHIVEVIDGKLTVQFKDNRKWYEMIGIGFHSPKITVYLPKLKYGDVSVISSTGDLEIPKDFKFESINISLSTGDVTNYASAVGDIKITTSTGAINAKDFNANSIELSTSTGDVSVKSVNCNNARINVTTGDAIITDMICIKLISKGSTGDINLSNVIGNISIERSTGDVKLAKCDGYEIMIETETGDVTGSLLSGKVFITNTSTGDVTVPNTISGGRCEIKTGTGDIEFSIIE